MSFVENRLTDLLNVSELIGFSLDFDMLYHFGVPNSALNKWLAFANDFFTQEGYSYTYIQSVINNPHGYLKTIDGGVLVVLTHQGSNMGDILVVPGYSNPQKYFLRQVIHAYANMCGIDLKT